MILVFVEPDAEGLSTLSLEALTFARALGGPIAAVAVGALPAGGAAPLAAQGVSVLHEAQGVPAYSGAAYAAAVVAAAASSGADVVLAAASPRGNEVMAHVAARLDQRMAANVTSASGEVGGGGATLVVQRQFMGGSAVEELELVGSPALLTMAGHAIEPAEAGTAADPDVEVRPFTVALSPTDLVTQVRRVVPASTGGADLASAKVVVGGGRGVGGPDRFDPLIELADRLGGALGVSRVVTSLGWRPHHEQVGQTGNRIAPDVYIACGISGAIQHWAGCASSKTIIAVNTDAEAPMVTRAHYAVIGDLHEVVPAINGELQARSAR